MELKTFRVICLVNGLTLDEGYALYQLYRYNKEGPPKSISTERILELIKRGVYKNNRISKELYKAFQAAEMEYKDGGLYEETMKLHGEQEKVSNPVRRRETSYSPLLDGIADSMYDVLTSYAKGEKDDRVFKNRWDESLEYFNNDADLTKYYITWLHLFPSNSEHKNVGWNQLFSTIYTNNAMIRQSNKTVLRAFKAAARKKDMRVYLISTYLFIKSYISPSGKCFIPKMSRFLDESYEWYEHTLEEIDRHKDNLAVIFDKNYGHKETGTGLIGNVV